MPTTKTKAPAIPKLKPVSAKDLQKKVEELTELSDRLKLDNEEIQIKFKLLCQVIVNNSDLSDYNYMDPLIEPYQIDIKDIILMVQKLAILSRELKSDDNLKSQTNDLELRINEITDDNENSVFKNFKLKERIDFIKQERDVWRRNAETYKKKYTILAKQIENPPLVKIQPKIETKAAVTNNTTENIDTKKNTLLTRQCCKNCKPIEKTAISSNTNNSVSVTADSLQNFFQKDFEKNIDPFLTDSSNQPENQNNNRVEPMIRNIDRKKFEGIPCLEKRNSCFSIDSSSIDVIDRPNLTNSRKNVSFNKDIDVGIYRKDSKNLKLIESYLQPLPVPFNNVAVDRIKQYKDEIIKRPESPLTQKSEIAMTNNNIINSENNNNHHNDVQDQIRNILNNRNSLNSMNTLFSIVDRRTSSPISLASSDTKYTSRASICSKRKFPSDTPVKNLEPTLKMIIIKELSEERVDGNNWKMFAKRIGISENEIKEWEALKLQYPMARVLSFWSSRSDATVRLLHKHLTAPCFNYSVLVKRIENFYDY